MPFARLMTAFAAITVVAAAGLHVVAPTARGQEARVKVLAGDDELQVWPGGGSRIGVSVRDVDAAEATREKMTAPAGAVVEEVQSDSPAAKAGMKAADVIVTFDGERVRSARQLERLVEETPAGRTVNVTVMRGGTKVDLQATPEASTFAWHGEGPHAIEKGAIEAMRPRIERDIRKWAPATEFNFDDWAELGWMGRGRLGVQVDSMSDQLSAYFGAKSGVLVTAVDDGSAASKAGVKAGDVVTAVNGQAVSDPADLRRETSKIDEGKAAELSIVRDRKPMTLKVDIEPRQKKIVTRSRRTV